MTKINLKAETRKEAGKKIRAGRRAGKIPAVIYGKKLKNQNLWLDYSDFFKAYGQAGESTIIELDIDGKNKSNVLIHDVQTDPLSDRFSHADFFQVRMDEKIETDVPLEFVGESEAVKSLGGVLVKSIDSLPVSCLPADLPSKIEVDITRLKNFNDVVKISDLDISGKVEVKIDAESVIANVAPPRSEEEIAGLSEKVEEDVSKVEGVVKETPEEGIEAGVEGGKKDEKKEKKDQG